MRLAWLVVAFAACSSSGSTVDVTMTFDSTVSDAALAGVTTLVLHASGDESGTYPISPGRALLRTERLVYRYAPATHSLGLDVDAKGASGALVASGSAAPISVGSTHTLTITLSAPSIADLAAPSDMRLADLATPADQATLPDLSVVYANPVFLSGSFGTRTGMDNLTVVAPQGVTSGTLLLAMVGGVSTTSMPVSLTGPAGWSTLTTASVPGAASMQPATATWFWRYATNMEPANYTFRRGDAGPMVVYVAAYQGTVDLMTGNGPCDAAQTLTGGPDLYPHFPSTSIHYHDELVVLNGFAPDDLADTWTTPMGYGARQAVGVFSGDEVFASYGIPVGGTPSTLDTQSRWIGFTVGLHGIGTQ